jgi:hypothetical protein
LRYIASDLIEVLGKITPPPSSRPVSSKQGS